MSENTPQRDFVETCRKLANFYEKHPDIPVPSERTMNIYVGKDKLPEIARAIGSCKKTFDKTYFELVKDFGVIEISFFAMRGEVCEKVVVGKKVVPEHVIPAREETVIAEHEEEVFEWRCPDALLAEGKD